MKERLTGAIILVALIVLLVPELLTGPLRSGPAAARPIASAEEAPLRSVTINLGDDSRASAAAIAPAPGTTPAPVAPADAASPPAVTSHPAPPADSAPPATSSAPAAVPVVKPSAVAPPVPEGANAGGAGWFVQLGSFASRANAERLAQQVRGRGFQVGVSRASTGRQLYRVRVGPVRQRTAAVQLQSKLRAAGHGGSVVPK